MSLPKTRPRQLGIDRDLIFETAARYLRMGYHPVPVGGGPTNKAWIPGPPGVLTPDPATGKLASDAIVMEHFHNHPNSGIGVVGRYLRDGSQDLLHIDVDVRDDQDGGATVNAIATIIGMACPFKFGQKGGSFTVRYTGGKSLHDILTERDLPHKGIVTPSGISIPRIAKAKLIDLIGAGGRDNHVNVPPTLHDKASEALGHDVFYEWRAFPGTDIVMRLEDTLPRDLPELTELHLLLIYQWAKNKDSPIWRYLGQTSPGDHHQAMLDASFYMYHERFTEAEIEEICGVEAERSAADDAAHRQRMDEIRVAVRALARKIAETKPAQEPKEARPAKVPLERIMADWLTSLYPLTCVAQFASVPYRWDEEVGHWLPMHDYNHHNPWREVYMKLYNTFETATNDKISSAIRSFANSIPPRIAAPDHTLIPFTNGLLDVTTGVLRDEERDDFIPATIQMPYEPDAECPLWVSFLKNLLQPPLEYTESEEDYGPDWEKSIALVEEYLGYCLTRSHQFQKMLYLIGKPGTGKSVLMKVFQALLPPGWVSTVSMDQFDDPNSRMQMAQAYVNIAAEVGRRNRDVDDTLLKVTVGEPVEVKLLYQNRQQAILPTRLIFHGNLPPDTTDSTGAMERRMLVIRTTDIKPQQIPEYEKRLLKEAPGIAARLVTAYARLLERREFDLPKYAIEAASTITRESNSATLWIDECCRKTEIAEECTPSQELYDHYKEWSERNGMKPMPSVVWGRAISAVGYAAVKRKMPGNHVVRYRKIKLITNVRVNY